MLQLTAPAPLSVVARVRARATPVLIGVATIFLIFGVTRDAGLLDERVWVLHVGRLVVATFGEVALLAWGVWLWSRMLSCFDGPHPGYRGMLRVWWTSTIAKYVPGSVWSVAVTADMAARVGASPVALPSSFLLQAALNFVGALTLAVLAGPGSGAFFVPTGVALSLVVGVLVLVHPRILNALVRTGARIAHQEAPTWRGSWLDGALFLALYIATWGAYGATFALLLSGITPISRAAWAALADANALAFAAGFLAFFAPGGVGVREAVLVVLLAPFIPGRGARVAIAASSRLWLVLTEALGVALVVVAERRPSRSRRWRRPVDALVVLPRPSTLPRQLAGQSGRDVPLRGVPVQLLTDTEHALRIMTDACRRATSSIWISQLAFDADCVVPGSEADSNASLLEAILHAARRSTIDGGHVDVRIVLNGGLLLDTSPALRRAIAMAHDGANVRVRTVKAFPQVMHAKLLVVDHADAFVMGSSFVNGYWDCARHTAAGDPGAAAGTGDRPLHDVAVRVQGPAASELARWFVQLWADAQPTASDAAIVETLGPSLARAPRGAAVETGPSATVGAVRILRTSPSCRKRPAPGDTEILHAYLDAIGRATECIYLESQYFSSRPIAQAVRAALDAHAELEVILVINQNPDVTAYRAWQNARLAEHRLLDHDRMGVFALWSTTKSRRAPGLTEITQVFIHSKVAVIDDAWATLGTANLDGASLHSYGDDFAGWTGRHVFGRYRNYDLNVELPDGLGGEPSTGVARDLRRKLWARHLGLPEACLETRPRCGWLDLWRTAAATNVARLAAGGSPPLDGRVLPYVTKNHPREQLRALGIDLDTAGLELRFNPGRVEVLFSPGWMKKVLPTRVRAWLSLT